ncbi:MAG: hypothetical protein ACXACU_11070, partial [Candidatus Hodarchaeales archaeon]
NTWGNNIGTPFESFWKKWFEPPIEINNILDNFYSLKNRGIALFLPPDLRKRLNSVSKEYERGRMVFQNFRGHKTTLSSVVSTNISEKQKRFENDMNKLLVLFSWMDDEPQVSSLIENLRNRYPNDFNIIDLFKTKKAKVRLSDFESFLTAESILSQLYESRKDLLAVCNLFCANTDDSVNILKDCIEKIKHQSMRTRFEKFIKNRSRKKSEIKKNAISV